MSKKFSKTGLILVFCMIVCLLIGLAVVPGGFGSGNKKDLDDENTPGIKTVLEDGSPLMIFDKRSEVKVLISDFDEAQVQSVNAKLSAGNDSGDMTDGVVHTDDPETITAVYKALKNIVIGDKLDVGKTADPACTVTFTLSDGSECEFVFESETVYLLDGGRYAAAGTEGFWSAIQGL